MASSACQAGHRPPTGELVINNHAPSALVEAIVLVPEQWRQQILDDPAGSGLDLHAHGQPGERLTRLWSTRIWVRSIDTRAAWSNSRPAGSLEPLAAPWIFPLELSFGLSRLMASCEMLSSRPLTNLIEG